MQKLERLTVDVIQIIFVVIIIVTMSGCVCDWIFSGMVNPKYVDEQLDLAQPEKPEESQVLRKDTPEQIDHVIFSCPNCGKESKYSFDVMQTFGKIRCHNCGSFITE